MSTSDRVNDGITARESVVALAYFASFGSGESVLIAEDMPGSASIAFGAGAFDP